MTPFEAYKNTSARARRFLTLYRGLVNTRERRIRADWRAAFNNLMHWPQDTAIERVDSVDAVIILRDGSSLVPEDFSASCLDDQLRAAIVYGVSALDRYMHQRVVDGIVAALKRSPRTRQQEEFMIPAVTAVQITEAIVRARREGEAVRPANEIRKKIQELLHARPIQSWREIDHAFRLLGISDMAGQVQGAMNVGTIEPIKNQLNAIVARRNLIVHEGDLVRHQRGGDVREQEIRPGWVEDSLTFLDSLIDRFEHVTRNS